MKYEKHFLSSWIHNKYVAGVVIVRRIDTNVSDITDRWYDTRHWEENDDFYDAVVVMVEILTVTDELLSLSSLSSFL
jgi:hypothetical protein